VLLSCITHSGSANFVNEHRYYRSKIPVINLLVDIILIDVNYDSIPTLPELPVIVDCYIYRSLPRPSNNQRASSPICSPAANIGIFLDKSYH